jgi:hypothetical protein
MPDKKPLAIDFPQEDTLLEILPRSPIFSSSKATWDGIYAEHQLHPARIGFQDNEPRFRLRLNLRFVKLSKTQSYPSEIAKQTHG